MRKKELSLSDVRTLIDRGLARDNPITQTEFHEFLKRPSGPQGHPDMVGWRRLPDGARLLCAMSNGELVWQEGDTVVWETGRRFDLPFKREEHCWASVNFILPDGTVVSHVRVHDTLDGMDRPHSLYIGANLESDSSWNVTQLSDSSVAWTSGSTFFRWHNGQLEKRQIKGSRYLNFTLSNDGRILGRTDRLPGNSPNGTFSLVDLNNEESVFFDGTSRSVELMRSIDELYLIVRFLGTYSVIRLNEQQEGMPYSQRFSETVLRENKGRVNVTDFVRLADGRFALEQILWQVAFWCLEGRECPRFEKVSSAFQVDGQDRYYGQLGDQIFTMRFPAPLAKG